MFRLLGLALKYDQLVEHLALEHRRGKAAEDVDLLNKMFSAP